MEPRFGQDFSTVKVHADAQAAVSARSVGALAYTVGDHLVFGQGQYRPGTPSGDRLLAHELTHVVQQRGSQPDLQGKLEVEAPESAAEREADVTADRVMGGSALSPIRSAGPSIMRTLTVAHASDPVPTPSPTGTTPTNAEAVEQDLRGISSEGNPTVDRSSGNVSMNPDFCQHRGFFGRLGRGMASGFMTGGRIGLYALGVGAIPGAILGALIGGIAGIFGADSQAEETSTPTSSTCLCDHVNGPNLWTIEVNDTVPHPSTGPRSNRVIQIPSPNNPRIWGAATTGGQLENDPPWLVLAHELCGHAWLIEHTSPDEHNEEGVVPGEDARHHRTVERENAIAREHRLSGTRGHRLRDPYCGESFYRDQANPDGPVHWNPVYDASQQAHLRSQGNDREADRTYLDECQTDRERELGELAHRYRVDQRIPDTETP